MGTNRDVPGSELGLYAPVDGTPTLVAARRGLELTESADTYDATHADNMRVSGVIASADASAGTITVRGLDEAEVKRAERGEIVRSTNNAGDYTWSASDVVDNGDGTLTITLNESIDDTTVDGVLYVPAPHGFREFVYGYEEWEISVGAVLLLDDQTGKMETSHRALVEAKRHGRVIGVVMRYPNEDGTSDPRETGDAIVTDVTLTSGYDSLGEVDITLQGTDAIQNQPTS